MAATINIRVGNGDIDGAQEGQHMANVCRLQGFKRVNGRRRVSPTTN